MSDGSRQLGERLQSALPGQDLAQLSQGGLEFTELDLQLADLVLQGGLGIPVLLCEHLSNRLTHRLQDELALALQALLHPREEVWPGVSSLRSGLGCSGCPLLERGSAAVKSYAAGAHSLPVSRLLNLGMRPG